MNFATPVGDSPFPDKPALSPVLVVTLFIEPMDFSGERLCAGVVAWAGGEALHSGAQHLLRYGCVYGGAVATLELVANLALTSLQEHLLATGGALDGLSQWRAPAASIAIGEVRVTEAISLAEAVTHGLHEFSSAAATTPREPLARESEVVGDRYASMSSRRLERDIRDVIEKTAPRLAAGFAQQFVVREGARPLVLGFCGRRIVANFATLPRKQLSAAVRVSKAKLWDLEQARDGATRGWFAQAPQSFELLLSLPADVVNAPIGPSREPLAEAYAELEYEADRKQIISRPILAAAEMARHLIEVEST